MSARITLVLLVIIPAAMGYPWHSPTQRWVLGVAIVVVVLVLAWWRGTFLITMLGRRVALWRGNRRTTNAHAVTPSDEVTVALSVAGASVPPDLPLDVVAGYVERYGVRCAKVRVTTLDADGSRHTWVSITVRANDNVAALAARSAELPLYDMTQTVARRLADHLRELGFETAVADDAQRPWTAQARETWRGMRDADGYLVAYAIPMDDALPDSLEQVLSCTDRPSWTAREFGGTAARPTIVALAAIRTDDAPTGVPVPGLTPQNGRHRTLLTALDPRGNATLVAVGLPAQAYHPSAVAR